MVLTAGATLIDFAGPWQMFVTPRTRSGTPRFQVYAVSDSVAPVDLAGGLTVVPRHTLENAPSPDIVLVPALGAGPYPSIVGWIRAMHARGAVIVSVCTGAFQLAEAGILDGLSATTHHDYQAELEREYPSVRALAGLRYARSSPSIYTAGGLTSGIDLALYLIQRILGVRTARAVAAYQEYEGQGWESGKALRIP